MNEQYMKAPLNCTMNIFQNALRQCIVVSVLHCGIALYRTVLGLISRKHIDILIRKWALKSILL